MKEKAIKKEAKVTLSETTSAPQMDSQTNFSVRVCWRAAAGGGMERFDWLRDSHIIEDRVEWKELGSFAWTGSRRPPICVRVVTFHNKHGGVERRGAAPVFCVSEDVP